MNSIKKFRTQFLKWLFSKIKSWLDRLQGKRIHHKILGLIIFHLTWTQKQWNAEASNQKYLQATVSRLSQISKVIPKDKT